MNKWVSVVLCVCGLGLGGMMLTGDSDGGRCRNGAVRSVLSGTK